jgi:hypothetical protein
MVGPPIFGAELISVPRTLCNAIAHLTKSTIVAGFTVIIMLKQPAGFSVGIFAPCNLRAISKKGTASEADGAKGADSAPGGIRRPAILDIWL